MNLVYNDGYESYIRGLSVNDNPYKNEYRQHWLDGFYAAAEVAFRATLIHK